MKIVRAIVNAFKKVPEAFSITSLSLVYALVAGLQRMGSEYQGFVCVFALAAFLAYDGIRLCMTIRRRSWVVLALSSWGLLMVSFALLALPRTSGNTLLSSLALAFIIYSLTMRFAGARALWYLFPCLSICIILVPHFSQIMLYVSYPLRMMSTICSAGLTQLFDGRIQFDQTMIHIQGYQLGITDACSGIQQLEAMLLVAYVIVRSGRFPLVWKVFHYFFIFPAVIIANSIRIIVTILLFYCIGEQVFNDTIHISLGYFQVVLVIVLFVIVRYVLPEKRGEEQ